MVNLNFWVSRDEVARTRPCDTHPRNPHHLNSGACLCLKANLDPESGGLVVFNKQLSGPLSQDGILPKPKPNPKPNSNAKPKPKPTPKPTPMPTPNPNPNSNWMVHCPRTLSRATTTLA